VLFIDSYGQADFMQPYNEWGYTAYLMALALYPDHLRRYYHYTATRARLRNLAIVEAVESGLVQRMIGESALAFQRRVESGEQKVVGVNAYLADDDEGAVEPLARPDPAEIAAQIETLRAFKRERDGAATGRALDALGAAANSERENVFEKLVEAAIAGATNGEICARLRAELGFGQPLVVP